MINKMILSKFSKTNFQVRFCTLFDRGSWVKAGWIAIVLGLLPSLVTAESIIFEGTTGTSTGELLEGASNVWKTVEVAEFQGLEISARTESSNHILKSTSGYFGIESGIADERDNAFDVGETLVLKFDQSVRIDLLDFNLFDKDDGDTFTVEVSGQDAFDVIYDDLDNKTSDYISFSSGISVEADTEMKLYVSSGQVGLDAIEVTVIPEPAVISFVALVGIGGMAVRRMFE